MNLPSPSIKVASSFGPPGQLGSWSPFKGRFKDQFEKKAQQTQGIESLDFFERLKPINKLQNLGQTTVWFCLTKRNKVLTNPCNNFNKSL